MGIRGFVGKGMCAQCQDTIRAALAWFQQSAEQSLLSGAPPSGSYWAGLVGALERDRIPVRDALNNIRPSSLNFLRRYVEFAFADDVITPTELSAFEQYSANLGLHTDVEVAQLRTRMQRAIFFADIWSGNLPTVAIGDVYLDLDERCHLDVETHCVRYLKTGVRVHPGRLLATNKKLRFLGPDRAWEIAWPKVLNIAVQSSDQIYLQTTQAKSTGDYVLGDPEYARVVLATIVRLDRREIVGPTGQRDTAQIPQHVKAEVWRRDHGRCCECGSTSYLEFDHVIPRSRGGATSVGNLQLLCRACNLKKRDRI